MNLQTLLLEEEIDMDITQIFCNFEDFIKGAEQTFKNSFPEERL